MSDASVVPTVQALLVRLEERDALIVHLKSEIDTPRAKVATLEVRLGKNSQNSSKPPSTDAFTKPPPRSLRRPSDRAPSKQPGDAGMRLEPAPDEVVLHEPGTCERCGLDLAGAPVSGGCPYVESQAIFSSGTS